MKRFFCALLAFAGLSFPLRLVSPAMADLFGSGTDTFEIEFVPIGNPGNAADTTGNPKPAGSVPYAYRIGKYEVSEQMIDKANAQSMADGIPLGITKDTRGPDKPATSIDWFEAARFVNWLNMSTGHLPAYKFVDVIGPRGGVIGSQFALWEPGDAGYNPNNLFRNNLAFYFLPSADEWYKAAFYDAAAGHYWDYPTGSNDPPIPVAFGTAPGTAVFDQPFAQGPADIMLAGGPSPFGTIGQAGNIWEWEETEVDLLNDDPLAVRGFRGSDWNLTSGDPIGLSSSFRHFIQLPGNSVADIGFRVASIIPEPTAFWLLVSGASAFLFRRSSNRRQRQLHLC